MRRRAALGMLVVAVMLSSGCQQGPDLTLPAGANGAFPTSQHVKPPPSGATVDAALSSDRPFTIVVLGDSTGNGTDEWVHLIAQRIATGYNRMATVHDWSDTANGYVDSVEYGVPGQPAVTVWNGSASGKGPTYSEAYYASMAPQTADLTIINHGHNAEAKVIVDGDEQLVKLAEKNSTAAGMIAVILQNPRTDSPARADMLQRCVEQLKQQFSGPNPEVLLVDVNSAFPHDASLSTFLNPDGLHPNNKGQQIWADAVAAAFHLR